MNKIADSMSIGEISDKNPIDPKGEAEANERNDSVTIYDETVGKEVSEEVYYGNLFSKYNLHRFRRDVPWELTYCVIEKDENVLLQAAYSLWGELWIEGDDDDTWLYGGHDFYFYIVEKGGKKYCKLIYDDGLGDRAIAGCGSYFTGGGSSLDAYNIGVFVPDYKKAVIENTKLIELHSGFDEILNELSAVQYQFLWSEDLFDYNTRSVKYDCYDFLNRRVFYADGYCLKKCKPYIDLLVYILDLADYYLPSTGIELVDDFAEVKRNIVLAYEAERDRCPDEDPHVEL